MVNARVKTSKKVEWDERENSIEIDIAPMSVSYFTCTPIEEKKTTGRGTKAGAKKPAAKTESKKTEPKKTAKKAESPKKAATRTEKVAEAQK